MARRIIIEAVACVTKYFVAASVDRGFFLLISMGIIASRLNSRPTHISIRIKMIEKYEMEASWPMIINGCSTGWPPIQVKISRLATRIQYKICVIGRNIRLRCFEV